MKDNSCAVVDELYSYLDSQKAFEAGFNLLQTLSSNPYTPQEVLEMWNKCIWEINDCPIISEWTLEFGSKEMLLNFLVFIGVDV